MDVAKQPITHAKELTHRAACARLTASRASWTSHSVVVVDQSGSIRRTDVAGGATRSDAVWLTLALDFVAKQLESSESTDLDVVFLNREGTVLVDRKPHDWKLFSSVVDLLRSQEPSFEGNYLPSLDKAEQLLNPNTSGSCAHKLFFLSDGKPTDRLPGGTFRGTCCLMAQFAQFVRAGALTCFAATSDVVFLWSRLDLPAPEKTFACLRRWHLGRSSLAVREDSMLPPCMRSLSAWPSARSHCL